MPIVRLLGQQADASVNAFEPDDIRVLQVAYDGVIRSLNLADAPEQVRELVAMKIIECARGGERDPIAMENYVLRTFHITNVADGSDKPSRKLSS